MSLMRILVIGDIVGRPGRRVLQEHLRSLRTERRIDFCVANAENAAGGAGVTPEVMQELFSSGIDVLTSGDHIYDKKEIIPIMQSEPRLLRPANYSELAAGKGSGLFPCSGNVRVGVVNVQGNVFMRSADNPFHAVDRELEKLSAETRVIVVDIHAEATSEKIALGWYLDGRASFVFGTHTHIQTADERVLPKGTAYITDVGMTGPYESVIGRQVEPVLKNFLTSMPARFEVAEGDPRLCGALATVDAETGRAISIERIVVRGDHRPAQQR